MNAKERLFELIIEYEATHPHRDWTIGIKPYSDIPMEVARKENFEHWELLADAILKEFVSREEFVISVNDKLPENEDMVMIFPRPDFDEFGRIVLAFYAKYDGGTNRVKKGNWYTFDSQGYAFKLFNVTHWMPIPICNGTGIVGKGE